MAMAVGPVVVAAFATVIGEAPGAAGAAGEVAGGGEAAGAGDVDGEALGAGLVAGDVGPVGVGLATADAFSSSTGARFPTFDKSGPNLIFPNATGRSKR